MSEQRTPASRYQEQTPAGEGRAAGAKVEQHQQWHTGGTYISHCSNGGKSHTFHLELCTPTLIDPYSIMVKTGFNHISK